MENKKWVLLCIIGGILMFLSSVVGNVSFFATIFDVIATFAPQTAQVLSIILWIFAFIAMGGGISVIIGALLVGKGNTGTGKFIIGLGAGMGLIGLIIFLLTTLMGGTAVADFTAIYIQIANGSYGFLGVLLTIYARMKIE